MKTERIFRLLILATVGLVSALSAGTIYLLPTGTSNQVAAAYGQDPFLALGSFNIPANTVSVYVNPSTTKLYSITNRSVGAVVVQAAGSSSIVRSINLGLTPTSSLMTRDGRYVAVLSGTLHVYDTGNDSEITPSYGVDAGDNPTSIASDLSSARIFVMSQVDQTITSVDLATKSAGVPLALAAVPNAMAVGPNGLLYVSALNRVYEIEPRSMTLRGTISVPGTPGPLVFTPDGTKALAINTVPSSGTILYAFDLTTRTVSGTIPSSVSFTFDKVVVASDTRAYGLSLSTGRVYQLTISPLSQSQASFSDLGSPSNVVAMAVSNELPVAKQLYLVDNGHFYSIDLLNNRLASSVPLTNPATDVMFHEAHFGTPEILQTLGNNQTVVRNSVSAPLVVRAITTAGKPVTDAQIVFSTSTAGASLIGTVATTNTEGYALTHVKVPDAAGSVTVSARTTESPQISVDFTVNTGGTNQGGGDTPTGTGVTILSGNGQFVMETQKTDRPLRVVVKDSSGNVVQNAQVTWTVPDGKGWLQDTSTTTNAQGVAETYYFGMSPLTLLQSFDSTNVTATAAQGSAIFTVTTILGTTFQSLVMGKPPILELITPESAVAKITGKLGKPIPGAIVTRVTASVGAQAGVPMPKIGLALESDQDPSTGPVPACVGGAALSNDSGLSTCDVVISGKQGTSRFYARVGGSTGWELEVTAEPGDPGQITVIQGSGQSGNPGASLPLALKGEVSDGYGNKLPGAQVTWEVVTPGSLTLTNVVSTADSNAQVSARVTLGSLAGTFQVRVRSNQGSAVALFNVTVNLNASNLNKVSGDSQSAIVGTAFAQPLVVQVVNAQSAGIQGAVVSFAVASGVATLSSPTATTGSDGKASVTVTAGTTAGTILVNAAIAGFTTTFTLTARAPGPEVTTAGIVNGVSGQAGVVPGGIVTIYGKGIATGISGSITGGNVVGLLPLKLANVEVLFGSTAAPIYNVSNISGTESVTVQAPFELGAPGVVNVTVKVGTGSTSVPNVPTYPLQPGLFETVNSSGVRYAVAIGDDGRYIGPGQGARPGEIVRVFVTGIGQTIPATGTNRAGMPGQTVAANLVMGFNNEGVRLVSAEYMVGVVGVYIVAFEVPSTATSGPKAVVVAAVGSDGTSLIYSNGSTLTVR